MSAVIESSGSSRTRWSQALLVLGAQYLWIGFLFRDTAVSMWTIWMRSETFTHCVLIVPITLWMVWNKRSELAADTPTPSFWPLLPVPVAGLGWLLGELVAVNALTQFMLVALLVLCVPATLGFGIARKITFPLAFLFLMVPFGEFVMPYMMTMTADFTVLALKATGIPVYREGLQFYIPSGAWSVVEACSGVRYLIASFTVGTLFAYLNYRSTGRRVIFVFFSLLVPILANWLRAYMIVMLGHLSGNKLAAGVDHLIYGWVFFGVVIMIMFVVGARWREDPAEGVSVPGGGAASSKGGELRLARAGLVAGLFGLLVAAPVVLHAWVLRGESKAPVSLVPPESTGQWGRQSGRSIEWGPAFEQPSAQGQWEFRAGDRLVGAYVGYYRNQNYERKLISSTNVLVKSNDRAWAQLATGAGKADFAGRDVSVRTAVLRDLAGPESGSARLVVRRLYWLDGQLAAGDAEGKLRSALARLSGNGDESAVMIFYAASATPGGADAALDAFMRETGAAFLAALERTKASR